MVYILQTTVITIVKLKQSELKATTKMELLAKKTTTIVRLKQYGLKQNQKLN